MSLAIISRGCRSDLRGCGSALRAATQSDGDSTAVSIKPRRHIQSRRRRGSTRTTRRHDARRAGLALLHDYGLATGLARAAPAARRTIELTNAGATKAPPTTETTRVAPSGVRIRARVGGCSRRANGSQLQRRRRRTTRPQRRNRRRCRCQSSIEARRARVARLISLAAGRFCRRSTSSVTRYCTLAVQDERAAPAPDGDQGWRVEITKCPNYVDRSKFDRATRRSERLQQQADVRRACPRTRRERHVTLVPEIEMRATVLRCWRRIRSFPAAARST